MTEIAFIVPLKSRTLVQDWARTCGCLEATLRSLYSQTCKNFRILLVCNEAPEGFESHENLELLQTDIRIEGEFDLQKGRTDKQRKTLFGLLEARKFDPKRVMVMDADDLLHKDVVTFAMNTDAQRGIILNRGYRYNFGTSVLRSCLNYHHVSGSSLIFPYIGTEFDSIDSYEDISKHYISRQAHPRPGEDIFSLNSIDYSYVPFFSGVYVRGHDQSLRDQFLVEETSLAKRQNGLAVSRFRRRTKDLSWKLLGRMHGSRQVDSKVMEEFPGLDVLRQLSARA